MGRIEVRGASQYAAQPREEDAAVAFDQRHLRSARLPALRRRGIAARTRVVQNICIHVPARHTAAEGVVEPDLHIAPVEGRPSSSSLRMSFDTARLFLSLPGGDQPRSAQRGARAASPLRRAVARQRCARGWHVVRRPDPRRSRRRCAGVARGRAHGCLHAPSYRLRRRGGLDGEGAATRSTVSRIHGVLARC
jgi:hypothetical protein